MQISYSRRFKTRYRKLSRKIKEAFKSRLEIFCADRFNPLLSNHKLSGDMKEYRSIRISGDIRAVYKEVGDSAYFVDIGSHSELYS